MASDHRKKVEGTVIQLFSNGKCYSQEFILNSEGNCIREDVMGNEVDTDWEENWEPYEMALPSGADAKELIKATGELEERAKEILKTKPNYEKDCDCQGDIETWTYHEWDFSNQDMLYKVCLKCGGTVEID